MLLILVLCVKVKRKSKNGMNKTEGKEENEVVEIHT